MKNFLKKNALRVSAAFTMITVAAFAVVGSGVTTALWSDTGSLDGATINSGNLNTDKIGAMAWRDVSKGGAGTAIASIAAFNVVPGDIVEGTQSVAIALTGNNMSAKLDVVVPALTGALASSMTVTFSVYDSADVIVASATNIAAGTTGTVLNLTPTTPGVVAALPSATKAFTVKIKATFNTATSARVNALATAALANSTVTVTQVRP